jgi:hypothetical protein
MPALSCMYIIMWVHVNVFVHVAANVDLCQCDGQVSDINGSGKGEDSCLC